MSDTDPRYILRVDAERLLAESYARLALIETALVERITARVRAGDDSFKASAEEVHRALTELHAASAALEKALAALPTYSKPTE